MYRTETDAAASKGWGSFVAAIVLVTGVWVAGSGHRLAHVLFAVRGSGRNILKRFMIGFFGEARWVPSEGWSA